MEFEFVQLAPGHLGYGQTSITIGDLTISSERVGKPLRVRMRAPPDFVSVSFMLAAGGSAYWRGHEIETSHALVFGKAERFCLLAALSFSPSARSTGSLPRRSGCGARPPRRLLTLLGARLAGDVSLRTRLLLGRLCDLARSGRCVPVDEGTRQFQLLQRAERLEKEWVVTSLDAMADGLGTSKRSLHRAFKDLAGLGPQSYLRILRLHQFRQRLVAGNTNDTIIRLPTIMLRERGATRQYRTVRRFREKPDRYRRHPRRGWRRGGEWCAGLPCRMPSGALL